MHCVAMTVICTNVHLALIEVVVLCAYSAQMLSMRDRVASHFDDVDNRPRVETIDNFQGEEADIVILSLVRSATVTTNEGNTIGFLAVSGWVCEDCNACRSRIACVSRCRGRDLDST